MIETLYLMAIDMSVLNKLEFAHCQDCTIHQKLLRLYEKRVLIFPLLCRIFKTFKAFWSIQVKQTQLNKESFHV